MIAEFSECCFSVGKSIQKKCNCFIEFVNNPQFDFEYKYKPLNNSILEILCYYNNYTFTKLFFEKTDIRGIHIDVNTRNINGNTPLHNFFLDSKIFSIELLKLMITKNTNVNSLNEWKCTPLMCHTILFMFSQKRINILGNF